MSQTGQRKHFEKKNDESSRFSVHGLLPFIDLSADAVTIDLSPFVNRVHVTFEECPTS